MCVCSKLDVDYCREMLKAFSDVDLNPSARSFLAQGIGCWPSVEPFHSCQKKGKKALQKTLRPVSIVVWLCYPVVCFCLFAL